MHALNNCYSFLGIVGSSVVFIRSHFLCMCTRSVTIHEQLCAMPQCWYTEYVYMCFLAQRFPSHTYINILLYTRFSQSEACVFPFIQTELYLSISFIHSVLQFILSCLWKKICCSHQVPVFGVPIFHFLIDKILKKKSAKKNFAIKKRKHLLTKEEFLLKNTQIISLKPNVNWINFTTKQECVKNALILAVIHRSSIFCESISPFSSIVDFPWRHSIDSENSEKPFFIGVVYKINNNTNESKHCVFNLMQKPIVVLRITLKRITL